MNRCPVAELVRMLKGNAELALIDPRETGDFIHNHLFAAANLPFSRLELTIAEANALSIKLFRMHQEQERQWRQKL